VVSKNKKEEIIKLKKKGLTNREIALKVLGSKSKQSTVFDIIKANSKHKYTPKVLLVDIETSPTEAWIWKRWKENITVNQVEQESFILTYSAKWLDNTLIESNHLTYEEVLAEDDSRIVKRLRDLFDEADILIGHNIVDFDRKVVNTRILYHDIAQPSPYKLIDTYLIAKKQFKFPYNSLEGIAIYLGLTPKLKPKDGFNTWKGYMHGAQESIEDMVEYNVGDVITLEEVYLKLRSWDNNHPNYNVYNNSEELICPCCGGSEIKLTDNKTYTSVSTFEVYHCKECDKWFRGRKPINEKILGVNII